MVWVFAEFSSLCVSLGSKCNEAEVNLFLTETGGISPPCLFFSFSTAVTPGDHLSAGKSAQSLTCRPLALISVACDSDGRVGLSWSTLLTRGIHGLQLVGGRISVYHIELFGLLQASNTPPLVKNLYSTFSFPRYSLFCYPGYRRRIGEPARLSDVMLLRKALKALWAQRAEC